MTTLPSAVGTPLGPFRAVRGTPGWYAGASGRWQRKGGSHQRRSANGHPR